MYAELLKKRRHAKKVKAAVKQQAANNQQMSQTASIIASEIYQRDDTLIIQIARQKTWKAAQTTDNSSISSSEFSIISSLLALTDL